MFVQNLAPLSAKPIRTRSREDARPRSVAKPRSEWKKPCDGLPCSCWRSFCSSPAQWEHAMIYRQMFTAFPGVGAVKRVQTLLQRSNSFCGSGKPANLHQKELLAACDFLICCLPGGVTQMPMTTVVVEKRLEWCRSFESDMNRVN